MTAHVADVRIGQRVRELRGEQSQRDLAEIMRARGRKWSQATVWAVESGKRPLKFLEALDLAAILRADVLDLLGDS